MYEAVLTGCQNKWSHPSKKLVEQFLHAMWTMAQLAVFFIPLLNTLAACWHQGSLAMLLMSMMCVWYVWPKARCFDGDFPRKFDRFPPIQTSGFLKFKIFVCSPQKLWFFNKSCDHIAQRGPWECLWSSSWFCIFISWSHLCLYPYIYVGTVFPLYQRVFKDLPCFFLLSPHSPIDCSTSALGHCLSVTSEKFLSCHITR